MSAVSGNPTLGHSQNSVYPAKTFKFELRRHGAFRAKPLNFLPAPAVSRSASGAGRIRNDWQVKASRPAEKTLRQLDERRTVEEIAQVRARTVRSVVALVAEMIERGDTEFRTEWLDQDKYKQIAAACRQLGFERLKPLKEALPPEITYEEIRLVVAQLRTENTLSKT
jgi:hypothetical protein